MTKKLHIKTWGCQMNEYDSSKMADLLDATHGYQLTEVAEEADVLLLNTCSIREKAQEKVFHQLGRWKLLKEKNPDLIIGVGGCVASQEGDHIRQRAHYVDIIFGPQTLHRLPEMINSVRGNRSPVVDISFPEIEKFDRLPEPRAEGPTAFVSIMEGCNKYCTYCVVPYTRGEEVSRPCDDILFEIAQLAAQGVRQLLHSGSTLAVTGGSTIAATAHAMQSSAPMNVMVVPAQGGFGREVETQANTLAAEIAQRLGGHHRLLHLPDHMDEQAKQEMLRLPEIRETMERIQRADIILHGIGCAQETMSRLPVEQVRLLTKKGAVGESFGAYYDRDGQCLLKSSGVCVDLARLTPDCRMIAVAAGAKKAEAIISVLRHDSHTLLVTDEGAAKQMLAILKTNTGCSSVTDV